MAIQDDIKKIIDRERTDVSGSLPDTYKPFKKNSFIDAILTALGARLYDLQLQLNLMPEKLLPISSTDIIENANWGYLKNTNIKSASKALGGVAVNGEIATEIPVGTLLMYGDSEYETILDNYSVQEFVLNVEFFTKEGDELVIQTFVKHSLAKGINVIVAGFDQEVFNGAHSVYDVRSNTVFSFFIDTAEKPTGTGQTVVSNFAVMIVQSKEAGLDYDLPNGADLAFVSPITDIDSTAFVQYDGVSGGANDETADEYHQRVLYALSHPAAEFTAYWYIKKLLTIPGITRAWAFPVTPEIGKGTLFYTRDNDVVIIPTPQDILNTKQFLIDNGYIPFYISDKGIVVSAPIPRLVDVSFYSISPDSYEMRKAIADTLDRFFRSDTELGTDLTLNEFIAVLKNTVDSLGNKLNFFNLAYPISDIPCPFGNLLILGTITYV